MRFTKMQGIGNDYVYVNCFEEHVENPSELAKQMSRRHYGVGSDGLILICPSDVADFEMKMYNADGSNGGMCGNGARCIGKVCLRPRLDGQDDGQPDDGFGAENPEPERQRRKSTNSARRYGNAGTVSAPNPGGFAGRGRHGASAECRQRDVRNPLRVDGQSALRDFRPRPGLCGFGTDWPAAGEQRDFSAARECRVRAGCLPRSPADARVGARRGGRRWRAARARVHRLSRR